MTPEFAVHTISEALMVTFWLRAAPHLGFAVGVAINLVQIATSSGRAVAPSRASRFSSSDPAAVALYVHRLSAYTIRSRQPGPVCQSDLGPNINSFRFPARALPRKPVFIFVPLPGIDRSRSRRALLALASLALYPPLAQQT
jgi:hypothetical protein